MRENRIEAGRRLWNLGAFAVALLCLLVVFAGGVKAEAGSHTSSDVAYAVEGGNIYFRPSEGAIVDCDKSVTSADISENIQGIQVTSIGVSAFEGCKDLAKITIPDSVTAIGNESFYGCNRLRSITIPTKVRKMGNSVFSYCSSLTSATLPGDLIDIGHSLFSYCSSLTEVSIPHGVTNISSWFSYSGLKSIVIPDNVTSMAHAFHGCTNLTEVMIPESVVSIGTGSFQDCTSLRNVTLPPKVKYISAFSFSNCSNLTSLNLPSSIAEVGNFAFRGCNTLADIYYMGSEEAWKKISIGGVDNANAPLLNATIHYNSTGPGEDPGPEPIDPDGKTLKVTVQAEKKDEKGKMVNVPNAEVTLFVPGKEAKSFPANENGVATVILNDLTDAEIKKATISAKKVWKGTVPETDKRYPLISGFGIDPVTKEAERYLYELHSDKPDEDGNWVGEKVKDLLDNNEITLTLTEPRLAVNMSVCFYEPDSVSEEQKKEDMKAVRAYMSDFSKNLAQATDGHVMVNKALVGYTKSRSSFFLNWNGDDVDSKSAALASMTDIKIMTQQSENSTATLANANPCGYWLDGTRPKGEKLKGLFNFSFPSSEEAVLQEKTIFARIEQAWMEFDGKSSIENGKQARVATHESGHYILGFRDEYMNAEEWEDEDGKKKQGKKWSDIGGHPGGAPTNFGLMEDQWEDIELSHDGMYSYTTADQETTATMQYYTWGKSCDSMIAELLSQGTVTERGKSSSAIINAIPDYIITYSKRSNQDPLYYLSGETTNYALNRKAPYPYAALNDDDFITFDGNTLASNVNWSSNGTPSTNASPRMNAGGVVLPDLTDVDSAGTIEGIRVDAAGTVTITPRTGDSNTYQLYAYDANAGARTEIPLTKSGTVWTGKVDASKTNTYEFDVVGTAPDGSLTHDTAYGEIILGEKGYLYESLDNCVNAYFLADQAGTYVITADNTPKRNGDYVSVNQSTHVTATETAGQKGELYSVAPADGDLDYTTVAWFRQDETGTWTRLDTDLTGEAESNNVAARCDYAGPGTYTLMAKAASARTLQPMTGLKFSNPIDRDGVIDVTFTDPNQNVIYYDIYASVSAGRF